MRALISPRENDRIADVKVIDYPVANPLYWIDCPDTITTNWKYVNKRFLPPDPIDIPSVPEITSVTMRQARLALLQYSLLDTVESTLNGPTTPKEVNIEWEYAATVDKRSPLVANMKAVLNLTDDQLTNLFNVASTL
jgi:hypothetical protein